MSIGVGMSDRSQSIKEVRTGTEDRNLMSGTIAGTWRAVTDYSSGST